MKKISLLVAVLLVMLGIYEYNWGYSDKLVKAIKNQDIEWVKTHKIGNINSENCIVPIVLDMSAELPINTAIKYGGYEYVKCLIDHGANVNNADKALGITPLIMSVSSGQNPDRYDVVRLLLENGADTKENFEYVDTKHYKENFIYLLLGRKDAPIDLVEYALSQDIDWESIQLKTGMTGIEAAIGYDRTDILKLALDTGYWDINYNNSAALQKAIKYDNTESIKMLLEYGADRELLDEEFRNKLNDIQK